MGGRVTSLPDRDRLARGHGLALEGWDGHAPEQLGQAAPRRGAGKRRAVDLRARRLARGRERDVDLGDAARVAGLLAAARLARRLRERSGRGAAVEALSAPGYGRRRGGGLG